MTDRKISVTEHVDLGMIKLVDPDTRFPWDFFSGGEINCAFETIAPQSRMNDIRIWINVNSKEPVYIERSRYVHQTVTLGFTCPKSAVEFAIKFGDIIKKLDD